MLDAVIYYTIKYALLPPGLLVLLGIICLWILSKWHRAGFVLTLFTVSSLYLFSIPYVARTLVSYLEYEPALKLDPLAGDRPSDSQLSGHQSSENQPYENQPTAIVVLGAGRYANAPEYGDDTVSASGLERVRYAAKLHHKTRLPVVLSGGRVFDSGPAEAELMATVLADDFGIRAKWLEKDSQNTLQNGDNTRELLAPLGIDAIYLVTHAHHMPRAKEVFEQAGFEVVPAPTAFYSLPDHRPIWFQLIPTATALTITQRALHEALGLIWYKYKVRREQETETESQGAEAANPAAIR